ncbi:fibronectin type III domain-containing protein [Nitrosopumilus maritimus]|nr:fibronectin type III domain-containing protein [Nitrosopumilus maritimus]
MNKKIFFLFLSLSVLFSFMLSEDAFAQTKPDRVRGLSATAISTTQIDLSWNEPSDGGLPITGYQIERKKASDPWEIYIADTGNTNTTYSDQGLDPDTRYRYKVAAINAIDIGRSSTAKAATTFAITEPNRVTGLSATTISPTQIDLSWNEPYDGESPITGYQIERKKASDPWEIYIADTGNTNTTYSDQGLDPDTRYRYKVAAINAIGIGTASTAKAATTTEITEPDRVTGLTATAISHTQINLSWNEPYDGESPITGYQIERKKASDPWEIYIADTGNTNTTYSDQGLDPDTRYRYKVAAINAIDIGRSSTIVTETTLLPGVYLPPVDTSTGTSKIRPPPQIQGIGLYKFTTHVGDDGDTKEYDAPLNLPFDQYFPYSKFSDETDFKNYKEMGAYKKLGLYHDFSKKTLAPKFFAETNQPVQLQIRLWDMLSSSKIEHLSLYTYSTSSTTVENSDVEIIFDKGKPLDVIDPNDIFKYVEVYPSYEDEWLWINLDLMFQKPMTSSNILLQSWHESRIPSFVQVDDIWEISNPQSNTDHVDEVNLTEEVEITHGTSNPTCKMDDSCFTPSDAKILEGGIITWFNTDSFTHTVTSGSVNNNDNRFGYILFPGQTVQHEFPYKGIYDYYCALHPWANGSVIVYGADFEKPETSFDESQPTLLVKSTSGGSLIIENNDVYVTSSRDLHMNISGHIQELSTSNTVKIIIIHPDKITKHMTAIVNSDGFYSMPVVLNKHWMEGTYEIITEYRGEQVAQLSFLVSDKPVR